MIDDRNKTELTSHVTSAAASWLDERGFKPLETEVGVCAGWVADLAGVVTPTATELQKLKLVKSRPSWKSPREKMEAWQRAVQDIPPIVTAIVEVKTSRADFVGDKKWSCSVPANLAYIAIPRDLFPVIRYDEWPSGWGRLIYQPDVEQVHCVQPPTIQPVTAEQQLELVLAVAVRRDNISRYERLREIQRRIRRDQNEHENLLRLSKVLFTFISIVNGEHGSLDDALQMHGIKNVPGYLRPHLEKLWAVAQAPR